MDKLISGSGEFELVMQDDGNLVIYQHGVGAIWASDSQREPITPDPPPPDPPARSGRVRLEGRSMVDDEGAWCALGTSLFWGLREAGSSHLQENLQWAGVHGMDFVRLLCETTDWTAGLGYDPRSPLYPDHLRAVLRQLADSRLRGAFTLFGGNQLSPADQERVTRTTLEVLDEAPALVQYVEISNEGQGFLDGLGSDRMAALARLVRAHGYPVATTSIEHYEASYAQGAASIATAHFDRAPSEHGYRPVRQPWGYWEYDPAPGLFINNEPIGIGSSVAQETDPLRLASAAIVTWIAGGAAHVVHTGAGIYGVPLDHAVGGHRPANLWEQPTLLPTFDALSFMRRDLPRGLPSMSRQNHHWIDHPFAFQPDAVGDAALERGVGCVRAYASITSQLFVCCPIGIMQTLTLTPKKAMQWAVTDILTGNTLQTGTGPITLTAPPEAVLVSGTWV